MGQSWGTVGPRDWADGTVLVIGTGPSLSGVPLPTLLQGRQYRATVTVKAAGYLLPEADACVCADWRWPRRMGPMLRDGLVPPLYLCVDDDWRDAPDALPPGTTMLRRYHIGDALGVLSPDPRALAFGGSSGFAGLNFAVLRGASRVVLLGFDYAVAGDGLHHADPAMYPWTKPQDARFWEWWVQPFHNVRPRLQALGVEVFNATPGSRLDAFPQVDLDAVCPRQ